MFARGTGNANRPKPTRDSHRSAYGRDHIALCDCRMHVTAPAGCEWSLRHRTICHGSHASDVKRTTVIALRQPGDLRADRYAIAHRCHADTGHCHMKKLRFWRKELDMEALP